MRERSILVSAIGPPAVVTPAVREPACAPVLMAGTVCTLKVGFRLREADDWAPRYEDELLGSENRGTLGAADLGADAEGMGAALAGLLL